MTITKYDKKTIIERFHELRLYDGDTNVSVHLKKVLEDHIEIKGDKGNFDYAIVEEELAQATKRFGKFNSYHEGYAVIEEETDELWDEIKGEQDKWKMKKEAVQVAAMAVRFIIDCCQGEENE